MKKIILNMFKTSISLLILFILIFNISCNNNSNKEYVEKVYQKIVMNIDDDNVVDDIFVPTLQDNVHISFVSSDVSVISSDGVVTRYDEDKLVKLTIYLEYDGELYTKEIDVIVPAIKKITGNITKQDLDEALLKLNIDSSYKMLDKTLVLPSTIDEYEIIYSIDSIYNNVVSLNGNVLSPLDVNVDTAYSFTVTIIYEDIESSCVFDGYVKANYSSKIAEIKEDLKSILKLENSYVSDDINFKTSSLYDSTIVWSISDESIVSIEGIVNKNLSKTTKVIIGYQIILNDVEYDFEYFSIYVIGSGSYSAYYSSAEGKSGSALFNELREIITNTHVKTTTYSDCHKYVVETDGDPDKKGNIILFYTKKSISGQWDSGKSWNREHVWPQSLGGFGTSGPGSDLHHIRPTLPSTNTARSNKRYGVSSGCYEPADNVKGDAARIIFYLKVRYSELDNKSFSVVAESLSLLLEWNEMDPVDDYEIRRNEAIYAIQGNRNPFIDYPEFAELIWGSQSYSLNNGSIINESITCLKDKCNMYFYM